MSPPGPELEQKKDEAILQHRFEDAASYAEQQLSMVKEWVESGHWEKCKDCKSVLVIATVAVIQTVGGAINQLNRHLKMKYYYEYEAIENRGYSSRSIYTCEDFSIWEGMINNSYYEGNNNFVLIRDRRYDIEFYGGEELTSQILIILETKDSRLISQALPILIIKAYLAYFSNHPEDFVAHMEMLRERHFKEGRRAKKIEFLNVLGLTEED